jgi:hypothetical protein
VRGCVLYATRQDHLFLGSRTVTVVSLHNDQSVRVCCRRDLTAQALQSIEGAIESFTTTWVSPG